jgi:predicted O-methyltransferase YrrM
LSAKLDLAGHCNVLDVAGGSGIYACALAARFPHLHASVMERPPVDRIALKLVAERGYSDQVSVVARDMFTGDWPKGHDIHLISNVLHDWDFPKVRQLLARSFESLEPGGLVAIHDAYIDREKTGPLPVASYSAMLMHSTEGKCYSVGEMEGLLAEAGFGQFQFSHTVVDRGVLTARKPA